MRYFERSNGLSHSERVSTLFHALVIAMVGVLTLASAIHFAVLVA